MQHLINHHYRAALAGRKYQGLKNCHVKGLHSIILQGPTDGSEPTIRMFCTGRDHLMNYTYYSPHNRLAVHPHRRDLTLVPLRGDVYNASLRAVRATAATERFIALKECRYSSALLDGEGSLVPTGEYYNLLGRYNRLPESGLFLPAKQLHHITTVRAHSAAWLILEGDKDKSYDPVCYTHDPQFCTKDMYIPMTQEEVLKALSFASHQRRI